MVRLNTGILFQLLIKTLQPDLVCDVGSMDARHAQRFRRDLPNGCIVAFEVNPKNIDLMKKNKDLKKDRIEIQHKAVWNCNGTIKFYVEHLCDNKDEDWRKGISSTRRRVADNVSLGVTEVAVPAVRLDIFILGLKRLPESVALWVDVEGGAFEVLEGIGAIRDRVKVIHIEVETKEIWCRQKLESHVKCLMKRMNFTPLARGFNDVQHDLVFVNTNLFKELPLRLIALVLLTFLITYFQKLVGQRISHRIVNHYFGNRNMGNRGT